MRCLWLTVAALGGAASLVLGALGRHWISDVEGGRENLLYAERYLQFHVLALIALALLPLSRSRWLRGAAWAFSVGTIVFCGTLYLRAAGQGGALSRLTPMGGTVLIAAWLLFAVGAWRLQADR